MAESDNEEDPSLLQFKPAGTGFDRYPVQIEWTRQFWASQPKKMDRWQYEQARKEWFRGMKQRKGR